MSSILLVTASPRGDLSLSSRAARTVADALARRKPGARIVHRDLAAAPLPHIDQDFAVAVKTPAEKLTAAQAKLLAASDAATDELLAADAVVIATGMINFSIASTLKSWFDHVARAHRTFRYTAEGPQGLAGGKKAYVVIASSGSYTDGGPAAAMDHARPYLKSMLGFFGITDIEFVDIEGVGLGIEPDAVIVERALGKVSAVDLAAAA
ncbi:MAG: NAD(P)H-dependent oxidoreductase [Nitratireductor sp.]|jgi:FMN-dependent NADH-azoreductase